MDSKSGDCNIDHNKTLQIFLGWLSCMEAGVEEGDCKGA